MKKLFPLFAIAFLALALLPFGASAAGLIPCGTQDNPATTENEATPLCGLCHLFVLGGNIINFFLVPDTSAPNKGFALVPIVATILIVVGGFLLMTAGGDPIRLGKAKAVLTAVVIGLIIIYASWLLLGTLFTAIGVNPDFNLKSWTHTEKWCPVTEKTSTPPNKQGSTELPLPSVTTLSQLAGPSTQTPALPPTSTSTPTTQPSPFLSPHAYILEDDGTFDKQDTIALTKKFYEKYPDQYDFMGFHYKELVKGGYTGAGGVQYPFKGTFGGGWGDFTSKIGSTKLLGLYVDSFDFNKMYVERDPNNSPIDVIDNVYFALIFHELIHYWGVNLPEQLKEATADAAHFEYGTGSWVSVRPTTRIKTVQDPDGKYYFRLDCLKAPKEHDFMLYSMGLKSPNEITEKLIVTRYNNVAGQLTSKCDTPVEVSPPYTVKAFTIQDFINVLGPRIPSVADSKKDFTIAFVMIVPKGETLSKEQTDALNWVADKFPVAWYKSTEGRSILNGIKPTDTTPPVISNAKISATKSSITARWTTNEPASSFVIYDNRFGELSLIYPQVITNPPKFSTTHAITVEVSDTTSLDPNAEYPITLISIDENYNLASFYAGTVWTRD